MNAASQAAKAADLILGKARAARSRRTRIASLLGLISGGQVLAGLGGRVSLPFAADVLTNIAFVLLLWRRCAPASDATPPLPEERPSRGYRSALREFVHSHAEGLRFLTQPARRPLLGLLVGAWLVEVMNEAYDGKMITKHVLHGTDDAVRYAALTWMLVDVGVAAATEVLRLT